MHHPEEALAISAWILFTREADSKSSTLAEQLAGNFQHFDLLLVRVNSSDMDEFRETTETR
jgi:hypothetical protein